MRKLNLLYGCGDLLHTHTNFNPFAEEETESIIRADVKNLDAYVDDSEADEIVALDVLDYLPLPDIDNALSNWIKKLRHGGTLVIGGTDIYEVSKAFSQYRLDIHRTNHLLHGEQTKPYLIKRGNFTALGLCDFLEAKGLEIQKKRVNDFHMIIEAKRP